MRVLKVLALVFGLVVLTNAQEAVLTGTVYDIQGAVIPGATIKMIQSKGKVYQAMTKEEGDYQFDVLPGIYSIEVLAVGFQKFRIKTYRVIPSTKGKQFLDIVLIVSKFKIGKCPKGQACL